MPKGSHPRNTPERSLLKDHTKWIVPKGSHLMEHTQWITPKKSLQKGHFQRIILNGSLTVVSVFLWRFARRRAMRLVIDRTIWTAACHARDPKTRGGNEWWYSSMVAFCKDNTRMITNIAKTTQMLRPLYCESNTLLQSSSTTHLDDVLLGLSQGSHLKVVPLVTLLSNKSHFHLAFQENFWVSGT